MIHSLQKKFIAAAILSVTLVTLILGITINTFNFLSTNDALNSRLEMIFENEGSMPQFSTPGKPGKKHDPHFNEETPFSTRYFVLRYTQSGSLLNANMKNIAAVTERDAETYLKIAIVHGKGFGYSGSYKFYVANTDDRNNMAIFLDCYDELHAVKTFALVSLLVVIGCNVLVFVLVCLLSKRAISPTLLSIEKQKQFITDAGHELKTPLTIINTSLKVLEMESGQNKWTEKIQIQTDRLSKLVCDLVTLSRLDEASPPLKLSDFDISEAVLEVVCALQDYANEYSHQLKAEITRGLNYFGDESAIRQLTSLLIDNAVKYSDPCSNILVRLYAEKNNIILQTENPCSSLEPMEAEKLFDRFYRVDKSRNSKSGGFGIGLSIAKSIVEAHQSSIKASLKENIIQFTVHLKSGSRNGNRL